MAGLAQILAVIILLIVLALCLDPLFEACGGPFFAILVRTVDRDLHGRIPSHDVSFLRDCLNTFSCLVYSLVTMLIASGLFCGSLFFPVVLYVVSVLILGFRNAFTFVAEAGFNRNWSLSQLKLKTRPHRAAICGFGAVTFFLAMVPFLSVVFSPACYVGATMLLNEICQDENPLHQQPKHDEITP